MDSNLDTSLDGTSKKSPFEELSREELITKCKGLLMIAHKTKQAKSELHNEIDNYKTQVSKYEEEKKNSNNNIKTLQELVDSLTEQKLNYITEIDAAKNKIKILNDKCNNFEQEIERLKEEAKIKDAKYIEISQNMSDLDSELISNKRQNKRLLEENEQLINQLSELESQVTEFNNIGLHQRDQLKILEHQVQNDNDLHEAKIEELNKKITQLQDSLKSFESDNANNQKVNDLEVKIKEITNLYEIEKSQKEKANIKLRSYKDKILKCAACISQLKNSRFILTKTIKEYSETIPKWQNDIINASQILDKQLNELSQENIVLKDKIQKMEKDLYEFQSQFQKNNELSTQISNLNKENNILREKNSNLQEEIREISDNKILMKENFEMLNIKYKELNSLLPVQIEENNLLKETINELTQKVNGLINNNNDLNQSLLDIQAENLKLNSLVQNQAHSDESLENLILQVKALETEKAILVKEKLNARDMSNEIDNRNKVLADQVDKFTSQVTDLKHQINTMAQEKLSIEKKYIAEKETEINNLHCKILELQQQYNMVKKEHDDIADLNGLLKEEVETLKMSLEQPKDDAENLVEVNVSLQADIVKLETKLSAYKQENSSLLAEMKESRIKVKEYDALASEHDMTKSKLLSYKTENTELLNEMKEINQVLKERGEAISKKQKAIDEMEGLIETLEKDRDDLIQEKKELQKRIDVLERNLKSVENKSTENNIVTDKITAEKDDAVKLLAENENIIATLKDELEKLKLQQSTPEMPNDDNMSASTISKAEEHSRMRDLDESFEEKYSKLRVFAMKLKKKLSDTSKQLEEAEKDKARLEKMILENEVIASKRSPKDEVVENSVEKLQILDLEDKVKSLSAIVEASENKNSDFESLKSELACVMQQLSAEIESHKITKDNLDKARRDLKKKNVLSLEMEDYERSLKELTSKMDECKKKMVQMESTIDTQEGTITAMKTQIKLLEEQIKTEETQNRLLKEELQNTTEESKEKDNLLTLKSNVIAKLEQDLEDVKRNNEEVHLEMTILLSDKEKVIINLGEEKVELNNKLKRLEFKCSELNEKLRMCNIELEDLKAEYTSYKVRAQAVLRQNQTVDHSQEEQLKEEAAALKVKVESLTTKLNSVQERYEQQSSEVEAARRKAAEAGAEAARAAQRTARLHADVARLSQQLDSERAHHKLQVSTLTQCYKTQISELESKYQKEAEELKKQMLTSQEDLNKQNKPALLLDDTSRSLYMLPVQKDENSDGEMDINVSMLPREEGEGSEAAPSPPPSKPYLISAGSGRSPVPLERLLEEGVPEDEAFDTASLSLTPEQEISELKRKLQAQQQRVKHITLLLAESEREGARMAQLSELLKSELRRVRGTTLNAHNTEYMKNVTLKFLTLPPGDERSRLVPVLQKILTLTNEEAHKIQAIAKGVDPNASRGWGSYLPWPGGK